MKTQLVLLFLISLCTGCQTVITPGLTQATPQLVIQGAVSDLPGPYQVSLSMTTNFYADNVWPTVLGAKVVIIDQTAGATDTLTETSPGTYLTHSIIGRVGSTYKLMVSLTGKFYTATSTMPKLVALDSVSFDFQNKTQIRAQANFQDPPQTANYYKYSLLINGTYDKRFQTFDDRLSDGKYIRDKVDSDTSEIKRNDWVELSLISVDKNVYTYLSQAERVTYSNSNLAAPATPTTNITGGCLGYFSAQTVSRKKAQVTF